MLHVFVWVFRAPERILNTRRRHSYMPPNKPIESRFLASYWKPERFFDEENQGALKRGHIQAFVS